ncbi:MAG: hypothetical protein IJ324_08825 [Lachnospiraceae bacterium]|nr:hypothetical protein [Lachnospiraceae bacterium]
MRAEKYKKWKSSLAIFLLALGLSFMSLPVMAEESKTFANVVIFVKMADDTTDQFNATYDTQSVGIRRNWDYIKNIYNNGTGNSGNNSFKEYIRTITEGSIIVENYFPQECTGDDGYQKVVPMVTYQSEYASSVDIVTEVINRLAAGEVRIYSDTAMDNCYDGILDNLTIIVQGKEICGSSRAFKATFGGTAMIPVYTTDGQIQDNVQVRNYNVMPSFMLISEDGNYHVGQEQGVVAHEFLHTLGLPDLYRYDDPYGKPVGMWDIMAANTCFLQYPLSYLRAREGWISMGEIAEAGEYTVTAVDGEGGTKVFAIKTPMAESDSEYICVEYRRKNTDLNAFEYSVPGTGLIMYRVDTKVTDLTNGGGENYIYVYRKGETNPGSGTNDDGIASAVLESVGSSYGSTDLSKTSTEDTLYYSNGNNSGIRIQVTAMEGDKLTFRVSYGDYTTAGVWDALGASVSTTGSSEPVICTDAANGDVYAAYVEGEYSPYKVSVKKWSGNTWEQVGSSLQYNGLIMPEVAVCGSEVYLAIGCYGSSEIYKLENGNWTSVHTCPEVNRMQLIVEENRIYAAYEIYENSYYRLVITDLKTGEMITNSTNEIKVQSTAGNASVAYGDGAFYVTYFPTLGGDCTIDKYENVSGVWTRTNLRSDVGRATTVHSTQFQNGKLYVFSAEYNKAPRLSIYDGVTWSDYDIAEMADSYAQNMVVMNGREFLFYKDNTDSQGKALLVHGDSTELLYTGIGNDIYSIDTATYGNRVYIVTRAENSGTITVRYKDVGDIAPSEEVESSLYLALRPAADYTDATIYIDGVAYVDQVSEEIMGDGSRYFVLPLADQSGKTAIMYKYNSNGVPIGMTVWQLAYENGRCVATALDGMEDVLSYHGFSIRVQGSAGIRCKFGLDSVVKANLINGYVDGYHMIECGTLIMSEANRASYPFIKGGDKVLSGRSYYVSGDTTYNRVLETVGGKERFGSVLIDQPTSRYATELAFRSYMILEDAGGNQVTLYGAPVSRSIYTLAKTILARGEFAEGTDGHNFVKSIVEAVEGK